MRGSEAAELLHAGVSKHKVALRMRATPLQPAGRHHSDKKKCEPRDRRMHSLSSVLVDIPPIHPLPERRGPCTQSGVTVRDRETHNTLLVTQVIVTNGVKLICSIEYT